MNQEAGDIPVEIWPRTHGGVRKVPGRGRGGGGGRGGGDGKREGKGRRNGFRMHGAISPKAGVQHFGWWPVD